MAREIKETSKYAFILGWVMELQPGEAFEAVQGQHFTCEVQSFAGVVYTAAATRGYKATVTTFPDEGKVVFAFYKADSYLRPNLAAYPVVQKMRRF